MKKVTKLFQTTPSSVDDQNKTVTFTISDNQPDRMGEVVDQESWDFKNYMNNPIVLWGHDPDEAENVLGKTLSVHVSADGSHTEATLSFATAINEKANMVFEMIKAGILRTVSVGFINHTWDTQEDTPVLKDNELLEISVVPIPANPRAIALSYKAGEINRKDASWLISSMKKETEALEKQLSEATEVKKEKAMTDEQFTEVMGAVSKLAETVAAMQTATDEKLSAVTEQIAAVTAQAEEAKADEDVKADEASKEEAVKDDSAKGGDDDQSGAEDKQDEFDPEAELTDEIRAEIDAQLAEMLAEEVAA